MSIRRRSARSTTDTEWLIAARRHSGSRSMLHRDPEPVRQRAVVLAVQFRKCTPFPRSAITMRWRSQRRLLVEQFGISTHRAGLRLVDGRHAGLSLGGLPSRHGGTGGHRLRQCQMFALQSRVPRRREGGADRGPDCSGMAVSSTSLPPACAPWDASMPDGRCRTPSIGMRCGARPASSRWKIISHAFLGRCLLAA